MITVPRIVDMCISCNELFDSTSNCLITVQSLLKLIRCEYYSHLLKSFSCYLIAVFKLYSIIKC